MNIFHWTCFWTSTRDFGTYCISDQRRLRRVCAYAQIRLSHRCSHAQKIGCTMYIDEGSDQNLDILLCWMHLRQRVRLLRAFAHMR